MLRLTCLALILLPAAAYAGSGKVTFVEGTATRSTSGGAPQALALDSEVEDGDTVETAAKARLELTLADGSVVRLGESGKLVVDSVTRVETSWRVKLTLVLGEVWSKVTRKVGDDAGYEVHTDRAVAGVRGTEFVVEAGADHDIEVLEGKVEVAVRDGGAGAKYSLERGHRLRVDRAGKTGGPGPSKGDRAISKWARGEGDGKSKLDRERPRDRREDRKTKRMDRRELRRERWLR